MEDSGKRRGRWEWRKMRHVQSLIFSSIESLGQFCVIFHFSVSFSCQLWQQLLSTILPTSPVAFLLPASTQRPSPQSSHLFSSYRIPQAFTWTRFCSGEIPGRNGFWPPNNGKFKEGQRSLFLLEWPMRQWTENGKPDTSSKAHI